MTETALKNVSRTDFPRVIMQKTAAPGLHVDGESQPVRKQFHSQQINPFAPGIEIIRGFGGIIFGFLGGKKSFKDAFLVVGFNTHAKIMDTKGNTRLVFSARYLYAAMIRGILDAVFDQAGNGFFKHIPGQADLGEILIHAGDDFQVSERKPVFQGFKQVLKRLSDLDIPVVQGR